MKDILKLKNNTEKKVSHKTSTFGKSVLDFLNSLEVPTDIPSGISAIYPYNNLGVMQIADNFYQTFYNDHERRIFVLGINPGRFGSGATGIPFTDSVALYRDCGIENSFDIRRELTSEFIYKFIDVFGGAKKFYADFFMSAVSPLGFIKDGRNCNYYDDPNLYKSLQPFIVKTLRKQISFGAKPVVIILGTGKNQHIFTELNNIYSFFDTVLAVEHPRYIMQYQRKNIDLYIKKYTEVFREAIQKATL